jgi:mannose/fructose/N-acetylgalactosamine-specific phosphotransferase system component IIB
MDFDILFKELKEEIAELAKDKFDEQSTAIVLDMEAYLAHSKEKLQKWAKLFKENKIDKDELVWLLKSQKDLLLLKSLQNLGISSISIGHFKNKIVDTVLSKIIVHTT